MSDDLQNFLARARAGASATAAAAKIVHLDELDQTQRAQPEAWSLTSLRGRLVELSARGATATLTSAASLVLEAQAEAEPVAWIVPWTAEAHSGTFYPPDAADSGIDLAALVVVRTPSVIAAGRAAERLLRSGAFGLVVLDFGASNLEAANARLPESVLGRLVTLAQANDAAVVCVTDKTQESGSLGSLVSLRVEASRARALGGFEVTVRALKDKRRGPGWTRVMKARGPSGI